MPDYLAKARALRRKADDPVVPAEEARALREKAAELETKFRNSSSRPADDTTVIGRDGFTAGWDPFWRSAENWQRVNDLLNRQHQWNPPPEEDIVEEDYAYQEDEDYGYDIYEGNEWQ